MTEYPVFKNFLCWYESPNNPIPNDELPKNTSDFFLREWILGHGLQYEIVTERSLNADSRDIGEITLGRWSSYADRGISVLTNAHFFFELEVDAMAFKLKFL